MRPHWHDRIEKRASAAMDLLMALAIGLGMAGAIAYWWTEQIP